MGRKKATETKWETFWVALTFGHVLLSILFFVYKAYFIQNSAFYNIVALTVPFNLLGNIFLIFLWIFRRKMWVLLPLAALSAGYGSILETVHINRPVALQQPDFTLMNYNIATCYLDRFSNKPQKRNTIVYLDTTLGFLQNKWLDSVKSDIICLQEYHDNELCRAENMTRKLVELGYVHHYENLIEAMPFAGIFGVATFSKYPIIKADTINFSDTASINRGVYVDVKINTHKLRIINVHMYSMSINKKGKNYVENLGGELDSLNRKLRMGFAEREKQIAKILYLAESCPYPVIICGDFNDVPYSYVYQKIKKKFKNSFETAGNGFGFTYNRFPYILRIDNQFYSLGLEPLSLDVVNNNKSDHYPLEGAYIFK